MSVKFTVGQKVNPQHPEDARKWYATACSKGETTLRELSKEISARSTVSSADVMAVLESMLEIIPQEISRGNIVRLGDFGNFSISVQSEGVETAEKFTSANIKSNKLHFHAGPEFEAVLNTLKYEKAES